MVKIWYFSDIGAPQGLQRRCIDLKSHVVMVFIAYQHNYRLRPRIAIGDTVFHLLLPFFSGLGGEKLCSTVKNAIPSCIQMEEQFLGD